MAMPPYPRIKIRAAKIDNFLHMIVLLQKELKGLQCFGYPPKQPKIHITVDAFSLERYTYATS
jgi:hypothetical protein